MALAIAAAAGFPAAAAEQPGKSAVLAEVDRLRPRTAQVNRAIWSYAEPGLEETRSSKELMDWLRENGFSVRADVAGMPTAFVASFGRGEPVIAYLAEYDALIGVSQKAVPRRVPRDDPAIVAGHGCGHSVYGTGSTAAAIALARVMAANNLPGTVRLYGTPAEETVDAKTFMLRAGLFDDVDVVLSWHASDRTGANYRYSKAVLGARFAFDGVRPTLGFPAVRPQRSRRGRTDERRLELPPRAPAHSAAVALRDYQRRRPAERCPAKASSWYYVRRPSPVE
jgi:aminobenzoyl-glutamate utilization protein B